MSKERKQIFVTLDKQTHAHLETESERRGLRVSSYVAMMLTDKMNRINRKSK